MNWYFWKCVAVGLAGFALHIVSRVRASKEYPSTLSGYLRGQWPEITYGLLSYVVLVVMLNEGSFGFLADVPYLGIEKAPPLNYLSAFLLGYFSSSIMKLILFIGTKFIAMVQNKAGANNEDLSKG